MQKPIKELERGDRVEITLSDGSEILGLLEQEPNYGPPITDDGREAGWDEKSIITGVHPEERNGSATVYDALMLTQERRGDEWSDIEVVGYHYDDGGTNSDTLDVQEVEFHGK